MKNATLHDLYYGRVSSWERCCANSPEHKEIDRKIESERKYFVGKMSLDDCQRFQSFENLYAQSSDMEQADAFSCGFRLGVCLMAEAFVGKEQ